MMSKGILVLHDQALSCVDRAGYPVSNRVQVTHTTTINQGAEAQLVCRVTTRPRSDIGIVEHFSDKDMGILLAATVAKADLKGRLMARCINTSSEPVTLRAGTLIGVYTPITSGQIFPEVPPNSVPTDTNSHVALPQHVEPLYEQAAKSCETTLRGDS